ncbi:hypothetical protein [Pseudotabrizicola sp.]|uniref:hypothetical protein n=1 Tax=Pseudotabrizicola sp. TaxID=2939647 RepID=UPI0027317055|nr:hypothetical protein [Pseudotabrizicola sp.]MDP2080006.1 hypothetical protein [Pseudotabrizicola sp.]
MQRSKRLLMMATLPLYLGPLLAGLSGMGWSAVPVFVALMALWLVVMRPHQWPRQIALWTPPVMVAAAAQVAINAVIVVVLFGVGRGLGGVAGFVLPLPYLVPVALSFLSIPLSRMVWDPVKGHQMDQALDQNHAVNRDMVPSAPDADPMLAALLDLPHDADPVLIADAIDAAMRAPGAAARLSQLEDALEHGAEACLGLREGLILWATDPARTPDDPAIAGQLAGFVAAGFDARLLALFAHRALPLLQAQPGLWSSYPDPATIGLALDPALPVEVQASLRALAAAVEAAALPEDRLSGA